LARKKKEQCTQTYLPLSYALQILAYCFTSWYTC